DGRIYGRGSCDMKAGLSSGIFALEALKKLNFKPDGDILFESVVGEESGGVGSLAAIERGYSADGAVILEPTSLCLSPIQSGALTFRLTVPGKATHAAMKWDGVNAIEKFAILQTAINDLEKRRHRKKTYDYYDDPHQIAPINLGTIHGGEWHSTVPEEVVVEGRFGVFPGESVDNARKALEETITETALNDPWMKEHPPVVEWFEGQFESGETAVDHPLIEILGNCHKLATGNSSHIRGVTYGSDLRLFTNHGKIPAVLYGPGDVNLAHAANENVEIEEVITATKVIALMIVNWCGGSF
ncbi:MAG TPA: ArgE/DapE family deacylase, partial [Candidatus Marinimicrobia bacterium]|nr:ArgE/DapE family deacylase [Candidatus Neomarinimicrobiota bacterium]